MMIAKALLGIMVAAGVPDMTGPEGANFSVADICSYAGPDRDYLADAFRHALVSKDRAAVSRFLGDDWALSKEKVPENLFISLNKVEKNTKERSFRVAQRRCVSGDNTSIFGLLLQFRDGLVEAVDLEITYDDRAFARRGEPLHWRRFENDAQLRAALSSITTQSTTEAEWHETMQGAGFVQCKREAMTGGTTRSVYKSPMLPPESMLQTLGANMSPNGRPQVGATFDASGHLTDLFKPFATECRSLKN
jgi:hypothetical protein